MARQKPEISTNWQSSDGLHNSQALRGMYPSVFSAIAEVDALGHRILKRASDGAPVNGVDKIVGLSLLRRLVTAFAGVRHLLEASSVQPALIVARSQFEVFLSLRYLVHGAQRRLSLHTPSSPRQREIRARYYMTASLRSGVYRRQAVLDGKEGAMRMRGAKLRQDLAAEIRAEIERLQQSYPTQHRSFGLLRCYPVGKAKPRYYDQKEWYSFGFRKKEVNSVKALATALGLPNLYFLIYSPLSELGHAHGIDYDVTITETQVEIHSPYNPEAFAFVAYWTCTWQMLALAYAAKAYCQDVHSDLQRTDQFVRPALAPISSEAANTVFL